MKQARGDASCPPSVMVCSECSDGRGRLQQVKELSSFAFDFL